MPLYGDAKREYQNAWMQKRRQSWIDENGPCVDCGSFEDLEVDHVDATLKKFNPAQIWSRRKEIRELELTKCVVRCNSCHKLKRSLNKEVEFARHEAQGHAKLTLQQVEEIRNWFDEEKPTYVTIAAKYNVDPSTIGLIIRKRTWI